MDNTSSTDALQNVSENKQQIDMPLTNPQPDPISNQNITNNTSIEKQPKTHKKWVIPIMILTAIFLGIFIFAFIFYKSITGPADSEYIKYLENKYGKDEGFYSTGRSGENGCPLFNAGFCEKEFASAKSSIKFDVRYASSGDYIDQYYIAKNYTALENHYRNLFDNIIPYDYSLKFEEETYYGSAVTNPTTVTAEQLLKNRDFRLKIYINMDYEDLPKNTYSELDEDEDKNELKLKFSQIMAKEVPPIVTSIYIKIQHGTSESWYTMYRNNRTPSKWLTD